MPENVYTLAEVQKHNKPDDCWVVVKGYVFDVTKFANVHPGGKKILLKEGGNDASKKFKMFHGNHVLKKFIRKKKICIGTLAKSKL